MIEYPGRKESTYYLVGLFGRNGGLLDERFVRALHRLYGARFARDVLFPAVVGGLRSISYRFTRCESSRLVAFVPSFHVLEDGNELEGVLRTDGWSVVAFPPHSSPGVPCPAFLLATWTTELAAAHSEGSAVFPHPWVWEVVTRDGLSNLHLPRHAHRCRHIHDQLLSGVPIDLISDPHDHQVLATSSVPGNTGNPNSAPDGQPAHVAGSTDAQEVESLAEQLIEVTSVATGISPGMLCAADPAVSGPVATDDASTDDASTHVSGEGPAWEGPVLTISPSSESPETSPTHTHDHPSDTLIEVAVASPPTANHVQPDTIIPANAPTTS